MLQIVIIENHHNALYANEPMCECVHAFIRSTSKPNPFLPASGTVRLRCEERRRPCGRSSRSNPLNNIAYIYARTVTTSAALEFVFVMYCFSQRDVNTIAKPGPIPRARAHHIHAFYLRTCIKSDCTRFFRGLRERTLLTRQNCQTVTRFQFNVILSER
jgi:hypothetical protein